MEGFPCAMKRGNGSMSNVGTEAIRRVERALEEIRKGRMVIVVDDEDRENEGDLVMAADKVTPEAINFMAKFGRGLICLTLTEERVRRLGLSMMVDENTSNRSTAFTVSIEARHGVSTGISAADRAHTVLTAVAADARPQDISSPGHVFPLRAVAGGVLQRAGHTEGSVDLARLAGSSPYGVICEVMNDDGTMARRGDLEIFAREHDLHICSIADLIQYRLLRERLVHTRLTGDVTLPSGKQWKAYAFGVEGEERDFLALVLGQVDRSPTLVRVHTGSMLGDVFGVHAGDRVVASEAIARIEQEGKGVLLFLPGRISIRNDLAFHLGEAITPPMDNGTILREFGLGAQVLVELGLGQVRLITNRPRKIAGLEGYGLEVVEEIAVSSDSN
jgi:3,4-dihydroxy 2-butanone 4-phosphate synthase/GTP cyclohydrolase II